MRIITCDMLSGSETTNLNVLLSTCSSDVMQRVCNALPQQTFVAIENETIVGAAVHFLEYDAYTRYFHIYVHESHRRKGIGSVLLQCVIETATNNVTLTTNYDANEVCSRDFYEANGFTTSFSSHRMIFIGEKFTDIEKMLKTHRSRIEPYTDKLFLSCAKMEIDAFAPLRAKCNIHPERIPIDNELRSYYANNNVHVLMLGNEVVGKIEILPDQPDPIDNLCVREDLRGHGFGCILMKFATNECIASLGRSPTFWVLDINKNAMALYTSLNYEKKLTRVYVTRKVK